MSPVSKGRKTKKRRPQRSDHRSIDLAPAAVREPPPWFAISTKAVLDTTGPLAAATGPRELEQATCELLGEQLHHAVHEVRGGLWFNWWFEELAAAAAARVREADDLGGEWLLLHGLAAIGSPALRSFARHQVNGVLKIARQRPAYALQPDWLAMSYLIKATGEIWHMRDSYGTRFAVIAGMSYPHGKDPSVFLFDIDACGFTTVAHAGAFDNVTQAAAAWRTLVGDTADHSEPIEVRTGEQLSCLAYSNSGAELLMGNESRDRLDNWFRVNRCVHDITLALKKSRLTWPEPISLYHDLDIEPMAKEFAHWYTDRHGAEPDQETVEALAEEWIEGTLPETAYSISPHRITFRRELIEDGWKPDYPGTALVKTLLPEWARWLGERSGLPAELIDRVTTAL